MRPGGLQLIIPCWPQSFAMDGAITSHLVADAPVSHATRVGTSAGGAGTTTSLITRAWSISGHAWSSRGTLYATGRKAPRINVTRSHRVNATRTTPKPASASPPKPLNLSTVVTDPNCSYFYSDAALARALSLVTINERPLDNLLSSRLVLHQGPIMEFGVFNGVSPPQGASRGPSRPRFRPSQVASRPYLSSLWHPHSAGRWDDRFSAPNLPTEHLATAVSGVSNPRRAWL